MKMVVLYYIEKPKMRIVLKFGEGGTFLEYETKTVGL